MKLLSRVTLVLVLSGSFTLIKGSIAHSAENTVLSTMALAQELQRLTTETELQRKTLAGQNRSIKEMAPQIEREIAAAEEAFKQAERSWEASRNQGIIANIIGGGMGNDELRNAMNSAKTAWENALARRAEIGKSQAQVTESATQINTLIANQQKAKDDVKNITQALDLAIKNGGMQMEYMKLDKYFDNNDDRLDRIENLYDKSLLGAYVQDKIAQLVNSQTICQAFNRCKVNDPKKVSDESIRNELFPTSTAVRKDSYNKVKSRSSKASK